MKVSRGMVRFWSRALVAMLACVAAACDGTEIRATADAWQTEAGADVATVDARATDRAAEDPDAGALDASAPLDVPGPADAGQTDLPALDQPTPDQPGDASAPPILEGCVRGDFTPFHGNLHSHTSYSDGDGTPEEAFTHARERGGLDFLAVTDHLEQLYLPWPPNRFGKCRDAADAADDPGRFVAICGFEYASGEERLISIGHNNVFFADELFPMVQLDFHDFYASLVGCARCVGQFNHPGENDLLWDQFAYFPDVDERMALLEFNGGGSAWEPFHQALAAGWHVSPAYNQDNHSASWGTANDRRSGLYLAALDRESLREALLAKRSFLSGDKNATLRLMAADDCWMGSRLTTDQDVALRAEARDADPDDAFAGIELWGPGPILVAQTSCDAPSCALSHRLAAGAETYVVARATQADGDVLVSAPIWISSPP